MSFEVQKRYLPSRAAAGPESLRGPGPGWTAWGTGSNPHGAVHGCGAVYCQPIADLCTEPGAGFREGPGSFNHAK
jgi:hypothetical protein